MKKTAKIILVSALAAGVAALVVYCVFFGSVPVNMPAADSKNVMQTAAELSAAAQKAWLNKTAVTVSLADNGSTADSADVLIDGNNITVTKEGIYIIGGTLTEGQLAVNCAGTAVLVLENAEISCSADSAINIADAAHTLIYLPEGTQSIITSGTEREITGTDENTAAATGAALYARDDLSFDGSGRLTVNGYINNAVATTDNLTVLGGELAITAVNNGLKGKDSVTVTDGIITVTSGNDGIKTDNSTDENCGNITVNGGEISIVSLGDGIQADKSLDVLGGTVTVTAGETDEEVSDTAQAPLQAAPEGDFGGMPNGETPPEMPNGETPPEMPNGEWRQANGGMNGPPQNMRGMGGMKGDFQKDFEREADSENEAAVSTKGLKSGGALNIGGGTVTVDSTDDCVHSNGSIAVSGGTLVLASGDDGIHADDTFTVSGGDITVTKSYEGIEANTININGGTVCVTSRDDGLNASGVNSPVLKISDGTLRVNAGGDGLDSNGDLIIEGGTVIVDGPENNGNGALDSGTENGGSILCNGGTVLAIGASGMAEGFGRDSEQCSFIESFSQTLSGGTQITVSDENGVVVFEYTSAKSFNSVVFSSPQLMPGGTYTLTAGEQSKTVVAGQQYR